MGVDSAGTCDLSHCSSRRIVFPCGLRVIGEITGTTWFEFWRNSGLRALESLNRVKNELILVPLERRQERNATAFWAMVLLIYLGFISTGGPHRTPATNNPTDIYAENLTSEVAADLIPLPPIETAYPAIKIEYGSKNDAVRKLHVKNQALVTKKNKRARLQMEGRSKAPNQFILYRREQLRLHRDTYASMSMKEASRVIGLKWRNESQEVKLGYLDQAEGLRKRREIIHAKTAASSSSSSREPSAPTEASEE
ncbi:hypothetical protein HDU80_008297 [Chytriomyces hyalinus]|nr:hypothetical protein HDU80_008297 [Chytriomyces hyalinus]